MKQSLFLLFPFLLLATPPGCAATQHRTSGSASPEAKVIGACRPGDADFVVARRELEAIGDRVEALAPDDDPKTEFEALKKLLAGPCFGLAPQWPRLRDAEPETAFALQSFWEAGGASWFAQFLGLHGPPPVYSWTVPTLRKSFGSDSDSDHPLAPLLCPLALAECGRETRDWELRARSAFEGFPNRDSYQDLTRKGAESSRHGRDHCRDLAVEKPQLERWSVWIRCLQETEARQDVLPLGKMRAPDSGWWILEGRRGHHFFCDEVRAYHLETGTAFVVSSCSRLVLRNDGTVDGRGTDTLREVETRVGQLPLDLLREAAWMAFLAPEVQEGVVLSGTETALPPEITPARRSGQGMASGASGGTRSSAQTRLNWAWSRSPGHSHSGNLLWPEDYDRAGYAHAVKLLQTAEASFVESCPRAALPKWVTEPKYLAETSAELIANLRTLMETELCSE